MKLFCQVDGGPVSNPDVCYVFGYSGFFITNDYRKELKILNRKLLILKIIKGRSGIEISHIRKSALK